MHHLRCSLIMLLAAVAACGKGRAHDDAEQASDRSVPPTPDPAFEALYDAAVSGDVAAAKSALDRGASVDAYNEAGVTPLIQACFSGHVELVEFLLGAGADPNRGNADDESPLLVAANTDRAGEVSKLLLAKRARLETKDSSGRTALLVAVSQDRREQVAILLQAGASVEDRDNEGVTVLMQAARSAGPDLVQAVIAAGADLDHRLPDGNDAVAGAALNDNLETLRALLKLRPEVPTDSAALAVAVAERRRGAMKLLLEHGADPLEAGAYEPWLMAAQSGHIKELRVMLAHVEDPAQGVDGGLTALHAAAAGAQPKAIRFLIEEAKISPDVRGPDRVAALGLAAYLGDVETVKALLDGGATVDAMTKFRGTPLRAAADKGHLAVAKLLLKRGADPGIYDIYGKTARDYALDNGHTEVARLRRVPRARG